ALPGGREDEGLLDRRGLRLPRLAHPTPTEARHRELLRLHLPLATIARRDPRQGADADPADVATEPPAPAAPRQRGPGRLGQLLQARSEQTQLQHARPLRLAKGDRLAATTPPPPELDGHQTTLPARLGDRLRWDHALQPGNGRDHPLPLPRSTHPQPLEP